MAATNILFNAGTNLKTDNTNTAANVLSPAGLSEKK